LIKGDGGAIGLTENDSALTRWTTAGPEVVRILQVFEGSVISATDDCQHHEQQRSFQRCFQADVDCLVHTLRDESPFACLKDREIMVLGSHSLADSSVAESISAAAETGRNQVTKFEDERLKGSTSIFEPLPRNKLHMLSYKPVSNRKQTSRLKVNELKTDCELFAHLYIACQTRDGDLDEFFVTRINPTHLRFLNKAVYA